MDGRIGGRRVTAHGPKIARIGTAFACAWLLASPAFAQFFTQSSHQAVFHEPLQAIYTTSAIGPSHLVPREWHSIDLKRLDPRFAEAVAVDLQGLLIITGNNSPATLCQIQVQFRRPGGTQRPGNYNWQHITDGGWSYRAEHGGSIRQPVPNVQQPFKRVALANGVFEFWWAYEPSCVNGVNLRIESALLP